LAAPVTGGHNAEVPGDDTPPLAASTPMEISRDLQSWSNPMFEEGCGLHCLDAMHEDAMWRAATR